MCSFFSFVFDSAFGAGASGSESLAFFTLIISWKLISFAPCASAAASSEALAFSLSAFALSLAACSSCLAFSSLALTRSLAFSFSASVASGEISGVADADSVHLQISGGQTAGALPQLFAHQSSDAVAPSTALQVLVVVVVVALASKDWTTWPRGSWTW